MCANEVSVSGLNLDQKIQLAHQRGVSNPEAMNEEQLTAALSGNAPVAKAGASTQVQGTQQANPQTPIKGVEVEKGNSQVSEGALKSSLITTKLPAALYENGKISPQLSNALANVASIGQDGTVTLKSGVTEDSFKQVLQNYLNNNTQSSELPPEVTFPEGTDAEWKAHLVKEGAIKESKTGEGEVATTTYTVADTDKLNQLTTKIENESGSRKITQNLDLEFTTITTTKPDNIVAADGLANNRKARKELQGQYEKKLQQWSQENPELRDEALANMKYGKQVDKRMTKMTKGKDGLQTPTEICKKYFDEYATQEEKIMYATAQKEIRQLPPEELANLYNSAVAKYNATKGEKEVELPKVAKDEFTIIQGDEYSKAKVNKNIAAITPLILATDALNTNPQALLRKMAIHDVLADRTKYCETEAEKQQILADDQKYFVKHMAKREVQAKVNEQNVENTTAHWNKASKKSAEATDSNANAIHTDIGRNGRKLVQAYPAQFGKRVAQSEDYDYKDTIIDPITKNKVTAYFKFDSNAWDKYWDMAADTREDVLQYAKDNHLTLNEARARMLTKDGEFNGNARRLSAEDVLGNGNGKTGVKELKRYRKLAKTTGRTVDADYTNIQRAGYALGNAVKSAATSFVTAGLGDLLSQYATVLVQVGGETFTVEGHGTGTYTVDETKWVTTTDHYIDKYGTTDVTHETPVTFKKTGTVDVKTSTPFTTPEGEKAVRPDNRTLKMAGGAAVVGGAIGLLRGLATMGKQGQDQGTYWDGVINLDEKPVTTTSTSRKTVQMTTEKPFEVRQGEYSTEKEVDKYRAVTYRGPEAYSGMYQTADGKPVSPRDFAKAYKKATGCNTMTKSFFYAIPELELNGVKFVLKDNAKEEYKKIKVGVRGTVQDKAINTPKTGEVHKGKIKRG